MKTNIYCQQTKSIVVSSRKLVGSRLSDGMDKTADTFHSPQNKNTHSQKFTLFIHQTGGTGSVDVYRVIRRSKKHENTNKY